ncbi:MAG: DUF4760 domain-containing protein [Acidimicrobiia bacterium]
MLAGHLAHESFSATSGADLMVAWGTIALAGLSLGALIAFLKTWKATRDQADTALRQARVGEIQMLMEMLQDDKTRKARGVVYTAAANNTDPSDPEFFDAAEHVAQTYNTAAFMVEQGILDRDLFVANWAPSITRMWSGAWPVIAQRRANESNPNLWRSFELLAGWVHYNVPDAQA